jgi:hypothetical protein
VVDAPDARAALEVAAVQMPTEIAAEADLVELRVATRPEERGYMDAEVG